MKKYGIKINKRCFPNVPYFYPCACCNKGIPNTEDAFEIQDEIFIARAIVCSEECVNMWIFQNI
jgi:hypothetical protein